MASTANKINRWLAKSIVPPSFTYLVSNNNLMFILLDVCKFYNGDETQHISAMDQKD